MASQPGAVATRSGDQEPDAPAGDLVLAPLDFRLNLQAKLAEPAEPVSSPEKPSIRKLTWEHVVPDRPEEPAASAATTVPLPPPPQAPPPPPPPAPPVPFQPPASKVAPAAPVEPAERPEPQVVEPPVAVVEAAPVETSSGPRRRRGRRRRATMNRSRRQRRAARSTAGVGARPDRRRRADRAAPYQLGQRPDRSSRTGVHADPPRNGVRAGTPSRHDDRRDTRCREHHGTQSVAPEVEASIPPLHVVHRAARVARRRWIRGEEVHPAQEQPKWSAELEPFATDVATTRGLQFKSTVAVSPLPVADYASRLAASVITTEPGRAEAWRALGTAER